MNTYLYCCGRECSDAPLRITWEPSLNPHIAVFAFEYFAIFAKFARLLPSLNPSYLPLYKSCLGVCLPVLARSDGKWLPESNQLVRCEPELWLCDTICVKNNFCHLGKPLVFNVYFYLLPPKIIVTKDFDFHNWFVSVKSWLKIFMHLWPKKTLCMSWCSRWPVFHHRKHEHETPI